MDRRSFLETLGAATLGAIIPAAEAAPPKPEKPVTPPQSVDDQAQATAEQRRLDRICRNATVYRADCHGAPPTEPDGGSVREHGRAKKSFEAHNKPKKPEPKPSAPTGDIDGCSALPRKQQLASEMCRPHVPKR